MTPFENIKFMALQLPMADRTRLVETLLASLSEEDEILAEWVEEAEEDGMHMSVVRWSRLI